MTGPTDRQRAQRSGARGHVVPLPDQPHESLPAGSPPHPPSRPAWHCERCDQPWPCHIERVRLAEQFGADRVGLATYMMGRLTQAARELPTPTPADLYERFVRWTG